jgi:hypothetical protein
MTEVQSLNMEEVTRFANLMRRKKDLDRQLKEIGADLAKMEAPLLEAMASTGLQSLKLASGGTLYVRSQIWPRYLDGKGRPDVIKALKADGLNEYLKEDYNAHQFAAFIRELDGNGDPLPEHLAQCVEPSERFKLVLTG